MTGIKAMCIAFSIYSKVPVPIFNWEEKEMQYHLIFFPWIGALIGLGMWLWQVVATHFGVGSLCYAMVGSAIPLLITGGFHVDGFLDTEDAFRSYRSKEEKLQILEDPHVGAFAVIMLGMVGMLYVGAFSEISKTVFPVFASIFFMTRCLSGLSVVFFPSAKKEGMLFTFANTAKRAEIVVKTALVVEFILCCGFMLFCNVIAGASIILTELLCFLYYYWRSKKELGGITGDVAGYFVTITEVVGTIVLAIVSVLGM